jgi:hypothetical protein
VLWNLPCLFQLLGWLHPIDPRDLVNTTIDASTAIDAMRDALLRVKMSVSNVIQRHNEAAHVVGTAMATESMAVADHCRNFKNPPPVTYEFSTSYASFNKVSDIIEFKAKAIDKEDPS